MLLTRIWTALLALLATVFLGALFLMAGGKESGFTEADQKAIQAQANAGMAALKADIQASPVGLGPSLLADSRIKDALDPPEDPPKPRRGEEPEEPQSLQEVLKSVANETLLNDYPLMSVAFVDGGGTVIAKTGIDEGLFEDVVQQDAFKALDGEGEFSASLGGRLFAVKVSRKESGAEGRRLVAIQAVDLTGNSALRGVLGTTPAGLVRSGEVVGEVMGGAKKEDLVELVTKNLDQIPATEGASNVFEIGAGADMRIGSVSRVPGPAGKGKSGTMLVVLSQNTVGVVDPDVGQSIKDAKANGGMGKVPWLLLAGFLVIALAFTFYLPHYEVTSPLRRLAGEFKAMVDGNQHQIFHDTYRGNIGDVARGAVAVQEATRILVESEMVAMGEEDGEEAVPRRPRSTRSRRVARGRGRSSSAPQRSAGADDVQAIDLPAAEEDTELDDYHGGSGGGASAPVPPPPAAENAAPAPTLMDTSDPTDGDAASLVDDLGGIGGGGGAPLMPGALGGGAAPTLNDEASAGPALAGAAPTLSDEASAMGGGKSPLLQTGANPTAAPPPSADPREKYFQEVFAEFVETKKACGESVESFTFEKFARKLRKNTEDLLKRPGVADVKFSVYVKDGKAALKAKVVKG